MSAAGEPKVICLLITEFIVNVFGMLTEGKVRSFQQEFDTLTLIKTVREKY